MGVLENRFKILRGSENSVSYLFIFETGWWWLFFFFFLNLLHGCSSAHVIRFNCNTENYRGPIAPVVIFQWVCKRKKKNTLHFNVDWSTWVCVCCCFQLRIWKQSRSGSRLMLNALNKSHLVRLETWSRQHAARGTGRTADVVSRWCVSRVTVLFLFFILI